MGKTLVAYFSASGVTAALAKRIAASIRADLYEIQPVVPYSDADLNWRDKSSRSFVEMKNKKFRPPIKDTNAKIANYSTILLGFPIWWYVAPTIVNTFLESYDFSGKTVILFATSGSSGLGDSAKELKPSVSETTVIQDGKRFGSRVSEEELQTWIGTLNL